VTGGGKQGKNVFNEGTAVPLVGNIYNVPRIEFRPYPGGGRVCRKRLGGKLDKIGDAHCAKGGGR